VLAATNHDLQKAGAEGTFRKDLYYRLKGVSIRVPPLRERQEDVAELAHYFLFSINHQLGMGFRSIPPETLELFGAYAWPGNVRELQGVIREAMLHGSGHLLLPEFLPEELHRQGGTAAPPPSAPQAGLTALVDSLLQSGEGNLHARAVEAVERVLLEGVLRHVHGHQTQASELLGISRNTLRQKLRSLNFAIDRVFTQEGPDEEPGGG
jgi:two-component system nitrogen regulation response regulator GlnG